MKINGNRVKITVEDLNLDILRGLHTKFGLQEQYSGIIQTR